MGIRSLFSSDEKSDKHAEAAAHASGPECAPPPAYMPTDPSSQPPPPINGGGMSNYDEQPPDYAMPTFDGLGIDASTSLTPATNKFPPSFLLHTPILNIKGPYYLGTPEKDYKQFCLRVNWLPIFTKTDPISIHDGPEKDDPVLASGARMKMKFSGDSTITLPARPGATLHQADLKINAAFHYESWYRAHYRFTMPVRVPYHGDAPAAGSKAPVQEETFEWRTTMGKEAKAMDPGSGKLKSLVASGWKLVRLGGPESGVGGKGKGRSEGFASDGNEVVAVMAHNNGWSGGTKPVKFAFLGSGLTGVLGEEFECVAVLTAMQLWVIWVQNYTAGAAS